MDPPFYQSNLLLNSVETPTFAGYVVSPNDGNMDFMALNPQETDVLGICNSRDSNSIPVVLNPDNRGETKMAYGRNTSLSLSSSSSSRMEERCCERTNILSLENVDLNLNNIPVEDGQAFTQSLNPSHVSQTAEHSVLGSRHGDNAEVPLCTSVPEFFESERIPYSNPNGKSSSGAGQVSGHYDRARHSVDGHRAAFKRKNVVGVIGESSSSHNFAEDLSIPSSSRYLPSGCSSGENQGPIFSSIHDGDSSECYPSFSLSGNTETSQRNIRARLNLQCQHDVPSTQSHPAMSSNSLSSTWSPGEPSSVRNPFIQSAEQSQPNMPPVPGLPHRVHHSPASSRIGSSSIPASIQRRMRLIASHEEANIRSLTRNGVAGHSTSLARTNVNQLVQDPPNWNPSNSNLSMSGNRVSTSSGIIPLPGPIREPSEMVPVQYPRNLAEVVRSSLFLSGGSESGHESSTLSPRHSGCSSSTQEPGQSSRAVRQGQPLLHSRTAVSSADRQRGFSALPLPARSRDGRNRMLSEIRNALDLIRRGVNLRFEDVFIFDQSGFYGRADLNDRHRDMRLDVDNMSYEELLALEERIGYVNTGLCEQTILKCLHQRKYSHCNLEAASSEQEPCCICREDYNEGEEIGILNCRHDFHTACIKQWLMIKNLCPICKTTALVEGHSTISDGTK